MFKWDNFCVILFFSFSYKKLLQCSFYENLKNPCKNRFFRKKFKKVCVLQRRACTQIQNFKRNYLENYNDSEHAVKTKNAPFFMIFPSISFFLMIPRITSIVLFQKFVHFTFHFLPLKDQSSQLQSSEKKIYSERSWKMEHFLFLRHVLNRCSFRGNCVWNFEFVTSSSL